MNRAFFRLLALLALALLFQTAPGPSRWGLDLPLIFVALVGVRLPLLEAAAWGALAGLGQDLLSSCGPGPHLAAKMLVGMLAHLFHSIVYRERVHTQTALVACCMTAQQLFLWWFWEATGKAPDLPQALELVLRSVAVTSLFGVVASAALVRLRRQYNDPATA